MIYSNTLELRTYVHRDSKVAFRCAQIITFLTKQSAFYCLAAGCEVRSQVELSVNWGRNENFLEHVLPNAVVHISAAGPNLQFHSCTSQWDVRPIFLTHTVAGSPGVWVQVPGGRSELVSSCGPGTLKLTNLRLG